MKIIVTMAGNGDRFINGGCSVPKPLLKIEGKPMIEHILKMFPNERDIIFVCNPDHLRDTEMKEILKELAPNCHIIEAGSGKGPVHSTMRAFDLVDDEEPVMVTYCDCCMHWDYEDFKRKMEESSCDGSLVSFKGFHPPHSTGDFFYAYIKEQDGKVSEVREKTPFTEDKNKEYASSGNYYFKKGKYLKEYFPKIVQTDMHYNGEYYVSLVYNLMINDGLLVSVYEGDKLLSFGTPEEVKEYEYWAEHFKNEQGFLPQTQHDCQILIPIAGAGSRFSKEGYKKPKPFIDVAGEEMLIKSVKSFLKGSDYTFIFQHEHIKEGDLKEMIESKLGITPNLIGLNELTKGGAQTCLKAENLDPDKPLFIGNCDGKIVWDEGEFDKLVSDESIDCIVLTFKGYPKAARNPESYGWVKHNNKVVESVSVKIPISDNPINDSGIISCFWFRKAGDFIEAAKAYTSDENKGKEHHIEGFLNFFKKKAVVFDIKRFIPFGTPGELETYLYWKDYFKKR